MICFQLFQRGYRLVLLCIHAILTWIFGLLCCASSFSTNIATASSVVELRFNPYSKHAIIIILVQYN